MVDVAGCNAERRSANKTSEGAWDSPARQETPEVEQP